MLETVLGPRRWTQNKVHFGTMHLAPLPVPEEVGFQDSRGSNEWAQACGTPHGGSMLNVGTVKTEEPQSRRQGVQKWNNAVGWCQGVKVAAVIWLYVLDHTSGCESFQGQNTKPVYTRGVEYQVKHVAWFVIINCWLSKCHKNIGSLWALGKRE